MVLRKKVVVIGDGSCGKTCLLSVFTNGTFPGDYLQTIHDVSTKMIIVDNREMELVLFDTAGQEDYQNLRRLVYPDTDVIIICFSIEEPDSLDNVRTKWVKEVNHFAPNVPIILVGTKKDLEKDFETLKRLNNLKQKPISSTKGHNLAHEIGAYQYVECSAKENKGVLQVFQYAAYASSERRLKRRKKWLCF